MQKSGDRMAAVMEELQARSQLYSETTVAIEEPNYNCPKCKDTGSYLIRKKNGYYIRGVEVEQDYYVVCECSRILKINKLIKSSAITKAFQKMSLKNFSTDNVHPKVVEMKSKAKQYYAAFEEIRGFRQNSIMLIGQPGCGKTHLLTAISNYLMHTKQVPVLYFPYKDGLNNIAANNFERKNEIMDRMKEVDVLFIDDLFKPIGGKVNVKSWQTEIIFEVVNSRYLSNKPLLISSELSLDDMLYIDEALTSRLFEMSQDFIVTIEKDKKANYRLGKIFEKR
ncbi:ATP-binding protein [Lysinibacillus sp. CD3-6]|uniref:DnaA ATPase domain-containing protein n=1 Tax=Lysinibacillus sp. CD3-6 TaxID=2892541 RepID=UPI0011684B6A|nr:DnaA/Hda family protein [Lysinibacillus sp. CD3-6]UED79207.1 ATP-binding protein [Lysinibacillus sp. CD3-6]